MKNIFVYNMAGFVAGIFFLYAYFNNRRPDGDPNYLAIMLITPATILSLAQLIVWWSLAFSSKPIQKGK